ncbi:methyltransferase domain-containing protein [Pengzhenrongella sicca]|uniref:Class I SAM-dependent methyltransferase n=1 Tax=Pengzhenrongella sicca TaxID=2819238 RepID=A0A8A4ZG62_9MICO|nr:methyltransferase domain-containing protein [Pengzhenrongella sicca]QTE31012.1 class I SAM-dependent methyltransferase [Pengzhenrongella sicca]
MTADVHFAAVFTAALQGEPCTIVGLGDQPQLIPAPRWRGAADAGDRAVLAQCTGSTIDLGCGPGRMAEHLAARGQTVLGVDLMPEAVAQTRARGVRAVRRDLFGPLPGEGHWGCALLADGNIGIGGDPVLLLRRARGLVAVGGVIVVDLAPPGAGLRVHTVHLRTGARRSRSFPWAVVGADAIGTVARAVGLDLDGLHEHEGRWFAVLRRTGGDPTCLG